MALSTRPWGPISESDYESAEAFCRACLVDLNEPGAGVSVATLHRQRDGLPLSEGCLERQRKYRFAKRKVPMDH